MREVPPASPQLHKGMHILPGREICDTASGGSVRRPPRTFPSLAMPTMSDRIASVQEWLHNVYRALSEHPFINGVAPHLLTVVGFLLAFFAIARLISERRQPSNTFAWLFAIAFIPYLGVP